MSDPAAQLITLRTLRATITDRAQGAALDTLIASLEAQIAPPSSGGDTITVGDVKDSQAIAVGHGARATVYIDGRQGKTDHELLAAYYRRLATRCRSMPLQGVYEQRSTGDSLAIDLEHVYTQLATTEPLRH